jgi:two-component system, sensor histidine kinase
MKDIKLPHFTSIRQKLILIILVVTMLSIITGMVFEMVNNVRSSKLELSENLTLDANLNADYLIPTYLFDDKKGAHDILQKLNNIPDIVYGAAYLTDETLYADYKREGLQGKTDIRTFEANPDYILVTQNIKSNDEVLGHITLIASTDIINKKTKDHLVVVLIILLISTLLALFLAYLLERIVSEPIRKLADVTREIHDSLDYSVRVKKSTNDEIGTLYDGFNDMIQSIENRRKERDIAEASLEEERRSLEVRVNERTKELKLAKEKAEEADNLKSSFLANMSHEIRTPLNAILGCSSLIRETSPSPEELEEYNKMMETSGKDLLKLIDDILDISRIEANQVKIDPQQVSVNKICEEVFSTFRQLLIAENPQGSVEPLLTKPFGDEDYLMNTDPLRLKQVLLNILNNAVKFTSKGSIELSYFPDNSREKINFIIKDSGIGIAKEQQQRIFERFTKVADIKEKHYRGTGLGLSIALKLTQLLKGEIRVESELNLGTTFYLSFPLTNVKTLKVKSASKEKEESLSFLSGKVILVAEDVEYNFRLLEILLCKNKNVKVIWAKDGREVVRMHRENPGIDLILMDIQLPELTGLEATKIIKSENPEIPIIAITAYAMPGDETLVSAAGCDAYMIKPVNNVLLIHNLSKFLSESSHGIKKSRPKGRDH